MLKALHFSGLLAKLSTWTSLSKTFGGVLSSKLPIFYKCLTKNPIHQTVHLSCVCGYLEDIVLLFNKTMIFAITLHSLLLDIALNSRFKISQGKGIRLQKQMNSKMESRRNFCDEKNSIVDQSREQAKIEIVQLGNSSRIFC